MNPLEQATLSDKKVILYHALLTKPRNELTDGEITIMYALFTDSDIQKYLQKHIKPANTSVTIPTVVPNTTYVKDIQNG
jgi:hypothetical protein